MTGGLLGPLPPGEGGFPAPRRLFPADAGLGPVLSLMRAAFAEHDGLVDPPSFIARLGMPELARSAGEAEVWALGDPPLAAAIFTPRPPALHIGKLAVHGAARRQGLAARLVALAESRARAQGLAELELQTRVELTGNHAAFAAMGFVEAGRTAHAGYDRPTSITFRRALGA